MKVLILLLLGATWVSAKTLAPLITHSGPDGIEGTFIVKYQVRKVTRAGRGLDGRLH